MALQKELNSSKNVQLITPKGRPGASSPARCHQLAGQQHPESLHSRLVLLGLEALSISPCRDQLLLIMWISFYYCQEGRGKKQHFALGFTWPWIILACSQLQEDAPFPSSQLKYPCHSTEGSWTDIVDQLFHWGLANCHCLGFPVRKRPFWKLAISTGWSLRRNCIFGRKDGIVVKVTWGLQWSGLIIQSSTDFLGGESRCFSVT